MGMSVEYPKNGTLSFKFNSRWGNIIAFLFFFLLFLFLISLFFNTKEIACQTIFADFKKTCVLNINYLNMYKKTTDLGTLYYAKIKEKSSSGKFFHSIVLHTSKGDEMLSSFWSNFGYAKLNRQVQSINQFLVEMSKYSNSVFIVPEYYTWSDWFIILSLMFMPFYSLFLLLSPILSMDINKNTNNIMIATGTFWKLENIQLALSDICEFIVEEKKCSPIWAFLVNKLHPHEEIPPVNTFISKLKTTFKEDKRLHHKDMSYRFILKLQNNKVLILSRFFTYNYMVIRKNTRAINQFILD